MTRRRAFTLIELLVAMSLFAAIVPMAGWMVYLLLRAESATADALADAITLAHFAHAFRADAHAAQSADVEEDRSRAPDRALLRLESPRTISYVAEPAGIIVRTLRNGSHIERREEFRLGGTETRFERAAAKGTIAFVHRSRGLTIAGGPVVTSAAPTIRVEAVVGRDRRFEHPASASKEPPPPALPMKPGQKGKVP